MGSRPHKDRPKRFQDAPGCSKASKLEPTWPQEGSQNRSKIDQNPILRAPKTQDPPETPPRYQNGPQNGFQIVAKSTSKSIQNSFNTDAKCACKLFLRHRRHSPTLEKALCHAPFLAYGILGRSPCHPAAAEGAKLSKMRHGMAQPCLKGMPDQS